jgi:hypothetical protein
MQILFGRLSEKNQVVGLERSPLGNHIGAKSLKHAELIGFMN